jgi:hypothetical protein
MAKNEPFEFRAKLSMQSMGQNQGQYMRGRIPSVMLTHLGVKDGQEMVFRGTGKKLESVSIENAARKQPQAAKKASQKRAAKKGGKVLAAASKLSSGKKAAKKASKASTRKTRVAFEDVPQE